MVSEGKIDLGDLSKDLLAPFVILTNLNDGSNVMIGFGACMLTHQKDQFGQLRSSSPVLMLRL